MKNKIAIILLFSIFILYFLIDKGTAVGVSPVQAASGIIEAPEGNDFATIELGNPWDMDSITDISRGFNGDLFHIRNFFVSNGVFSGQSTDSYASFYVLHPGYLPGMRSGTIGFLHPINPNKYSCVYVASYVPQASAIHYHWFSWVKDMHLTEGGGYTYGMRLNTNRWMLYSYNLATWPHEADEEWTLRQWQGLRLIVTDQTWTNFQVDWVRLTDCNPVLVTIAGLTFGNQYDLWIGHGNPERQILAASGISPDNNGRLHFDVQGIEPDIYTYYVKQGNNIVKQGKLIIHAKPVPEFVSPSPITGEEYSEWAGNSWDLSAPNDIAAVYCAEWNFDAGVLNVYTRPGSQQPKKCKGLGDAKEADPKIYLNSPRSVDISTYRYLAFRQYIGGPWQLPAKGMVVRWIWRTVNPNDPSKYCEYVSPEVVLDVGWRTYWTELYDTFNGLPVETGGTSCPQNIHWKDQHNALLYFRIDPNENITNETFHQKFDWIGLYKMDSVEKGHYYYVRISLNKRPETLVNMHLYYTDNLSNPKKYSAQGEFTAGLSQYSSVSSDLENPPQAIYRLFVPMVFSDFITVPNLITFRWNTASVAPGIYYICTESHDGFNQSLYCSKAPVVVSSP